MSARKKTGQKVKQIARITPKIDLVALGVTYRDLENKDCFIMDGGLWIKCEDIDQEAVNLGTGELATDLCDNVVLPVDVTITWKLKK